MKYISLATHNNELIIINDMDAFAAHFCYSKKQRQGKIDNLAQATEDDDGLAMSIPTLDIEESGVPDEEDL